MVVMLFPVQPKLHILEADTLTKQNNYSKIVTYQLTGVIASRFLAKQSPARRANLPILRLHLRITKGIETMKNAPPKKLIVCHCEGRCFPDLPVLPAPVPQVQVAGQAWEAISKWSWDCFAR
jgi:hypothetical protein